MCVCACVRACVCVCVCVCRIDVTEAQFLHMGLLMVGAICGTDIWLKKVNRLEGTLKELGHHIK